MRTARPPPPLWTLEHWMTLPQLNPKAHHELQLSHPLSKPLGQWISGSPVSFRSCARVSGPRTWPDRRSPTIPPHGRNRPGFPRDPSISFPRVCGRGKVLDGKTQSYVRHDLKLGEYFANPVAKLAKWQSAPGRGGRGLPPSLAIPDYSQPGERGCVSAPRSPSRSDPSPPNGAMGAQNSHFFSKKSTHSAISHRWRKGVANHENV